VRTIAAMDYDAFEIAASYDKGRAITPEALRQWHELLTAHIDTNSISLVIDLGCGTGRSSELLAAHFAAKVIAIEPSQKMLDQCAAILRAVRSTCSVLRQKRCR
jgi:trans-aconitate methyltransferase